MERFLGMTLDTTTVPQAALDVVAKERSNLFPWNGQFSPQLVEVLLTTFADKAETVLDPFVGSGTVVHEAAKLGKEVFGSEINPAAFKMAQTYRFMGLRERDRRRVVEWVDDRIAEFLPDRHSLFAHANGNASADAKEAVLRVLGEANGEWELVVVEALVILADFHADCTEQKLRKIWGRLRSTLLTLERAARPLHVISGDARQLPLADDAIDFVLTSPPYVNVFNYHQHYRRSAEAIGWNLLEVAKAEIGSNRKHRGNRLLTVIQYCLDVEQVLREMARVCRHGARVVVVVGRESNVRKTPIYNGDLVAHLAVRVLGWSFLLRQERRFMNRFGLSIVEDVLHFAAAKPTENGCVGPRQIAEETLVEARSRVPDESRADLEDALSQLADVRPSPMFDARAATSRLASKK